MINTFCNIDTFPPEKQDILRQMAVDLQDIWDNASDEVMPFICRKKSENVIVSVIMPVYNVEKFLTKALQSIIGQTLEDIEIICVDDGSDDRSPEILSFFAACDERITIITQPNSNAGVARNKGMNFAKGKFIYFMDSDDWCLPEMLEKAVDAAEKNNCDIAEWSFYSFDNETRKPLWIKNFPDEIVDVKAVKNLLVYLLPAPWNKLFRADMIRKNALRFQEITNNNDTSFSLCALALANQICTIGGPMYFYRKSGTGLQATLIKDPFCCIKARIHIQNEIKRLGGVSPEFQDHFINAFYYFIGNQLMRMPLSLEQLIEVRDMLRENFDYGSVDVKDIVAQDEYYFIQSMFFSNEEFYPTRMINIFKPERNLLKKQIRELTDKLNKREAQYKKLEKDNKTLVAENKKLKKSLSYHLGRALTWLPRKLRGGVRCLKDHGLGYTVKRVFQKIGNHFSKPR